MGWGEQWNDRPNAFRPMLNGRPQGSLFWGTLANRPLASQRYMGYQYFATDQNGGTLYYCDGTQWTAIAGAVTINSGQIGSGQVGWPHIASGAIGSGDIASGAVLGQAGGGAFCIASGTIGTFDIGSGAVQSGTVSSGVIARFHLASGAVNSGQIASGAITGQLGGGAFNIASGTIGLNDLGSGVNLPASGTIQQFQLGSGAVNSGHVGSGAIMGSFASGAKNIASGTIGVFDLASGLLSGAAASVASGAIQQFQLGSGAVNSGHVGSGAVVGSYGSGAFCIASGTIGVQEIGSGVIISGAYYENYLVNGGMWFAQKWAPTIGNVIASGISGGDVYSADRFKVACSSGSSMLFTRFDRLLSGWVSGLTAQFYGQWQMGQSGGKFAVFQPLEAETSQDLANKNIEFQVMMKSPTSGTLIRIGILGTTSGNSNDVIPNSFVSGWSVSTSGTDPTWGSGVALLAPAVTAQLSNNWSGFSVPAASQSGHVNLFCAAWANNALASGTILHASEWGLYMD